MPGFFDVKITFNDFIGNWDGNYIASGRTRLIQGASLYSFPLSASIPGESASYMEQYRYITDAMLLMIIFVVMINGLFACQRDISIR